MTPGTIFISHRAEYGNLVRELKKAIEATSRGRIAVFISEELRGADNWREAINSQLVGAESLFLVYGAPYEDWSWWSMRPATLPGLTPDKNNRGGSIVFRDPIFRPLVP